MLRLYFLVSVFSLALASGCSNPEGSASSSSSGLEVGPASSLTSSRRSISDTGGPPRALPNSPLATAAAGSAVRLPRARGPLPALRADLHVDTVTAMMARNSAWSDTGLEASLPAIEAAGVNVIVQAAWVPRGTKDPRGAALGKIHRIRNMVLRSGGRAALVTGPTQLEQVLRDGRIAVIIALEGGTALSAGVATLDEFRALGLSMVGLTWTESSQYADSSAEPRETGGGLTAAGREMVAACNARGMLLDVSHMSDQATADTVSTSRAPVLASHSNARALCAVPRNLSDALLQAIARKGGLIGAMFHGPFVAAGGEATRADVVLQVLGLVDRVGAEHVGLGSDWDGRIKSPVGLTDSRDLPSLYQDLRAGGLSERELRQVAGDNLLALWRRAWNVRDPQAGRPQTP